MLKKILLSCALFFGDTRGSFQGPRELAVSMLQQAPFSELNSVQVWTVISCVDKLKQFDHKDAVWLGQALTRVKKCFVKNKPFATGYVTADIVMRYMNPHNATLLNKLAWGLWVMESQNLQHLVDRDGVVVCAKLADIDKKYVIDHLTLSPYKGLSRSFMRHQFEENPHITVRDTIQKKEIDCFIVGRRYSYEFYFLDDSVSSKRNAYICLPESCCSIRNLLFAAHPLKDYWIKKKVSRDYDCLSTYKKEDIKKFVTYFSVHVPISFRCSKRRRKKITKALCASSGRKAPSKCSIQ